MTWPGKIRSGLVICGFAFSISARGSPKLLGDAAEGVPGLDDIGLHTPWDVDDLAGEDQVGVGDLRVRCLKRREGHGEQFGDTAESVPRLDNIGSGWREGTDGDDDDLAGEDQVGVW